MSDEEKKAIEQLKGLLKNANPFTMPPYIYFSLETALNLIEKQDKLIDLIVQDVSSDVCNSKKCSQYENCKECKLDKYRKRVEENE